MKKNSSNIDKYSMLTKQILALHFSGTYITNKEFIELGKKIGIDVDLADRETVFKKILSKAIEENIEAEFFNELSNVLKSRFDEYKKLADEFANSSEIIKEWMQKLRSLDMLIKQRARMSIYE
ncbi:hypothetical protein [Nitrosophilus kaiyonis]|uniref:hypothetical protein n=1 Tax=Nitrosophilus kaiyonis TaxID=2930200 RepID=UPI00248F6585|nr:hypothetical protein [Nitrosophilus kaiyonis]